MKRARVKYGLSDPERLRTISIILPNKKIPVDPKESKGKIETPVKV